MAWRAGRMCCLHLRHNRAMNARMWLVWLAVMNLGVVAWWLWHPEARATTPAILVPDGVATLQLLDEHGNDSGAAAAPVARVAPIVCVRFGPFDAYQLGQAETQLRQQGMRVQGATEGVSNARAYDVGLPVFATRADADAMATRLRAAGFSDLVVIANGDKANGIALGRFGSQAAAQQHAENLRAKGFEAQVLPVGGTGGVHWLDVVALPGFDAAAVQRALGAGSQTETRCPAGLVAAG